MMIEELILPLTLKERAELGEDTMLRVPASFEEYLELVEECEYNIEYFKGEIISMGSASYYHEKLVMLIGVALSKVLSPEYTILGSNIKIQVSDDDYEPNNFNADVSVVKGEPEFMTLPSGRLSTTTILNPIVIVEVSSKSTFDYDFSEKLPAYKKIPSLQQVVFVSQYKRAISVFERQGPNKWLNTDSFSMEDSFSILGSKIDLQEIYK